MKSEVRLDQEREVREGTWDAIPNGNRARNMRVAAEHELRADAAEPVLYPGGAGQMDSVFADLFQ